MKEEKRNTPPERKAVKKQEIDREMRGKKIDGRTVKARHYARLCEKEVWVEEVKG